MALKALNSYAAYLAMRHAQDQEAIVAELALALYPLWQMVQFEDLDSSMLLWLPAVLPRIRTAFLQSQRVTAVFTQNVRFASLPTEDPLPISVPDVELPRTALSPGAFDMPDLGGALDEGALAVFDEFPEAHVAESLTIEADFKTKKQMPGPREELMEKALVRSSGEAIRQAVDGSRGVTENIARRDRKALGYARVTDSDPCSFCAILASWGAVYHKDSFKASNAKFRANAGRRGELPAGFTDVARVHNNCKCTLRPVFTKASDMDAAAKYWLNAWNKVTEKNPYLSNREQLRLFDKWHRENPFPGVQFDLHQMERDLRDRRDSLLDAGFAADSPQVLWAERAGRNIAA